MAKQHSDGDGINSSQANASQTQTPTVVGHVMKDKISSNQEEFDQLFGA